MTKRKRRYRERQRPQLVTESWGRAMAGTVPRASKVLIPRPAASADVRKPELARGSPAAPQVSVPHIKAAMKGAGTAADGPHNSGRLSGDSGRQAPLQHEAPRAHCR